MDANKRELIGVHSREFAVAWSSYFSSASLAGTAEAEGSLRTSHSFIQYKNCKLVVEMFGHEHPAKESTDVDSHV